MKKEMLRRGLGAILILFTGAILFCACQTKSRDGWDVREDGAYYLVDGEAATGWLELDGGRYYLAGDGQMVTGWQTIDGETYYFRDDGVMVTGWQELEGSRYYFGTQGVMETGWIEMNGQRYYLDPGAVTGWQTIDGASYYFRENGAAASGWLELEGKRCYFQNGSLSTGWLDLDGQRYYLNPDGSAARGLMEIDGTVYVFDGDGRLSSGWVELDGKKAYGDTGGHPVTGWLNLDGQRYYFDASGILYTGWLEMDGFRYYLQEDGSAASGETVIDGQTYYFASNGQQILLVNPWHTVPEDYTVELVSIGGGYRIAEIAYDDFSAMMADCRAAGFNPVVCSAYRTQGNQETLYNRKVEYYVYQGYSREEAKVLAGQCVAVPGTSEHQLGLALDIIDANNWSLDASQANMPTQQWLMANSWRYGFILRYPVEKSEITGIVYEPWHYRYVGREVAAEIFEQGVCLEEYLTLLTVGVG